MRGNCPALHQTCNNCYKEGDFANVCISTNKSLNYLDSQNPQPTTAEEALDRDNFFNGAIFDIQWLYWIYSDIQWTSRTPSGTLPKPIATS